MSDLASSVLVVVNKYSSLFCRQVRTYDKNDTTGILHLGEDRVLDSEKVIKVFILQTFHRQRMPPSKNASVRTKHYKKVKRLCHITSFVKRTVVIHHSTYIYR